MTKNGKTVIRFYMHSDKDPLNVFNVCYTYETDVSTLCRFFKEVSFGQGYNKYYKWEDKRTDFVNYKSKEKGFMPKSMIDREALSYGSNNLLEFVGMMMTHNGGYNFTLDTLCEIERTTLPQLKAEKEAEEIKKQAKEFRILGGDY